MRIDGKEMACAMIRKELRITDLEKMTGLSRCTIQSVKSGKSCQKRTGEALAAILGRQIIVKED